MRRGAAAAMVPVVALLIAPAKNLYEHRPPPGHTGGFGEPSCASCHFDNPVDDPDGLLEVRGLPGSYTAGERYLLSIVLQHPELRRGGFQLAVRGTSGEQAGALHAVDVDVEVMENAGVRYAQHTRTGSGAVESGVARWRVEWQAPASGDEVTLHVAANAANGDASEFGDRIFLREFRVGKASGPEARASPIR